MFDEQPHIVRFVNTFTAGEWPERKPNERNRKGISITKPTLPYGDQFVQPRPKVNEQQFFNDQNQNTSNINPLPYHLLSKVQKLEQELELLRRQKSELQMRLVQRDQQRPIENFVESQYIACKEDLDDILEERKRLGEAISSLQAQNGFLKLNMGIQQQFIIKVQTELNTLKAKPPHVDTSSYAVQTDSDLPKCQQSKSSIHENVQTQLHDSIEYQSLTQLAEKFEEQTNEFYALIEKLECQKSHLQLNNQKLSQKLSNAIQQISRAQSTHKDETSELLVRAEALNLSTASKQQQIQKLAVDYESAIRDKIAYYQGILEQRERELQSLRVTNKEVVMNEKRLQQQFFQLQVSNKKWMKELSQSQKHLQQAQKQLIIKQSELLTLREQLEHKAKTENALVLAESTIQALQTEIGQLSEQLKQVMAQQDDQQANLKAEYSDYRNQIDQLLLYLEQKSDALRKKEMQVYQQLQTEHLLHLKNEESLCRHKELEALISHYESQIKITHDSLHKYVAQLILQKNEEQKAQIDKMRTAQQANSQQERMYLLNKIDQLQLELINVKEEGRQMERTYRSLSIKLEERESTIVNLRSDLLSLSAKYESEVALRSKSVQEHYSIARKLAQEEQLREQISKQLQQVKVIYDGQMVSMQRLIDQLQAQLHSLEQESIQAKQAFQMRLLDVKRDYDILYAKYLKYKTLSIHLQTASH